MHLTLENVGSFELAKLVVDSIVDDKRDSMIDLCCCHCSLTSQMKFRKRTLVDIIDRKLDVPAHQKFFVQADVLGDNPIFSEHYDVAMCLDGIEHLKKDQGWMLVERMKNISDVSIIFTPSKEWMMEPENSPRFHNDPESHKSFWTPQELDGWASITFPRYHEQYNVGAFFSWYRHGVNMKQDFLRVKNLVKQNIRE